MRGQTSTAIELAGLVSTAQQNFRCTAEIESIRLAPCELRNGSAESAEGRFMAYTTGIACPALVGMRSNQSPACAVASWSTLRMRGGGPAILHKLAFMPR